MLFPPPFDTGTMWSTGAHPALSNHQLVEFGPRSLPFAFPRVRALAVFGVGGASFAFPRFLALAVFGVGPEFAVPFASPRALAFLAAILRRLSPLAAPFEFAAALLAGHRAARQPRLCEQVAGVDIGIRVRYSEGHRARPQRVRCGVPGFLPVSSVRHSARGVDDAPRAILVHGMGAGVNRRASGIRLAPRIRAGA